MMRIICFLALALAIAPKSNAYNIEVKSQYKEGVIYLAYYLGQKMYVEDSTVVANNGIAIFKNAKNAPGGVYSIVFPGRRYSMDLLLDKDQEFSVEVDTTKLPVAKFIGSADNEMFQQYQGYTASQGKFLNQALQSYKTATTKADSSKYEAEYKKYNGELIAYRDKLIKENPSSLLATLFTSMKETEMPDFQPKTKEDSTYAFNFYKSHYWDSYTFLDERVVRTPFFVPKLENYYRNVIALQPVDSIIKDIDYKLLLARNAPELYKYLLNWFTDEYIAPKYMGQDAIFLNIFNKYHSKGLTSWLNQTQMDAINKRAYMIMGNQVGIKAADLNMATSDGKTKTLYSVDAPYTVVIFWDPDCGHCKQDLPRIDSIYKANWKAKGVQVYAVNSSEHFDDWKAFIKEKNLNEFINVYQTAEGAKLEEQSAKPSYRQNYDIVSTPTLYLLDKDKKIVAKKLTFMQINDFLEFQQKEKK